jgi:hypothetical protein
MTSATSHVPNLAPVSVSVGAALVTRMGGLLASQQTTIRRAALSGLVKGFVVGILVVGGVMAVSWADQSGNPSSTTVGAAP